MEEERIDQAIQRIEAALARINAASDRMRPPPSPADTAEVSELTRKNEALRAEVATTLGELDQLIEEIES